MKILIFTLLVICSGNLLGQATFVGTTEPIREAQLSFPESGIISDIPVQEGQTVREGQLLAGLATKVLNTSLRMAMIQAESNASVKSAEANWNLRKRRYDELSRLVKYGSANKDEVARAKAEFEISSAELAGAQEEQASKKIQVEQISAQIDRHSLESPFNGVITRIFSEVSEIVQPAQPVMTVAQLDSLYLILHISHQTASKLKIGQTVNVKRYGDTGGDSELYSAKVSFISPITDSASGTTRVKLTIPNNEGRHRAGLKYSVSMP